MKNRYVQRAKLSERDFRRLVGLFALDFDATRIAKDTGLSRSTVNSYLRRIRLRLAEHCLLQAMEGGPLAPGEVLFMVFPPNGGADPQPMPVLTGLVRGDKTVQLEIPPDRERDALRRILRGRMHFKGWYQEECVVGFSREIDLDFANAAVFYDPAGACAEVTSGGELVELFLSFVRFRLTRFRGLAHGELRLHLKECEFRFNVGGRDLKAAILSILKRRPLP